ncbi:MAG: chemotaxis protein CheW [Deltaproteobacteria bacterium]|nr:chemotaxis protein CheW [Deltaproteobacteria bacterium]
MARRARTAPPAAGQGRTLMFAAAGLPLGVPLEDLLRVTETVEMLPMPMASTALAGVVESLEGVTPIYDLATLSAPSRGPPPRASTAAGLVALFPHAHGSVGIRVDRLAGLSDAPEALGPDLQKNLVAALPAALQPFITGAATSRGQLFFFFSRDAFLSWVGAARDEPTGT